MSRVTRRRGESFAEARNRTYIEHALRLELGWRPVDGLQAENLYGRRWTVDAIRGRVMMGGRS